MRTLVSSFCSFCYFFFQQISHVVLHRTTKLSKKGSTFQIESNIMKNPQTHNTLSFNTFSPIDPGSPFIPTSKISRLRFEYCSHTHFLFLIGFAERNSCPLLNDTHMSCNLNHFLVLCLILRNQ